MKRGILITGGAWYHEAVGGAYKIATELAEYLAGQGHRVFYLAGSKESKPANPTVYKGVEVWRYSLPRAQSPSLSNLLVHIFQSRKLARQISRSCPIAYLNGHDPLQFLGAFWALKRKGIKTSFSVHSPFVQENKAGWGLSSDSQDGTKKPTMKQKLALRLLNVLERSVYARAEIVQAESQFTLREIRNGYGRQMNGKGVVCGLWVDLNRFQLCRDKALVRQTLGPPWQSNLPVFFTLRRLVPRMGIDYLIEAMGFLKKQGLDCRLVVGGSGPEGKNLAALIHKLNLRDRVFMIGAVKESDVPLCYQAADCFVLPTKNLECFGLTILEAYASGTPAIATPVGAIPEVVGNIGQSGLTAEPSAEALAGKMEEFIRGKIETDPSSLRTYAGTYGYREKAEQLAEAIFGSSNVNNKFAIESPSCSEN